MELSLDDVIKQNRINRPRRGFGIRGSRGGTFRGRGGRGSFRASSRGGRPGGTVGGVFRGRGRGGISRTSVAPRFMPRSTFPPKRFSSASDTTKLIVSNLDFGVTDSDILELFSEFGPMRSAGVHYDRSGRSLGSADLVFERRPDAIKAMKQYNGVPLDGRAMKIQLATSEVPLSPTRRVGNGGIGSGFRRGSPTRGGFGRGRGRGGRGVVGGPKRGGAGGKPVPKKQPTAEELDAELEEYAKNKIPNSIGA